MANGKWQMANGRNMLNKEEVKHIAQLARLSLSDAEMEKIRGELFSILTYVKKLEEVDVSDVEPTTHVRLLENITREDIAKRQPLGRGNKLIEAAPETKEGYIKVKAVLQ